MSPLQQVLTLSAALWLGLSPIPQGERSATAYYQKWLNEDVLYLVTDEEKAVFGKLTTNDERDAFIE